MASSLPHIDALLAREDDSKTPYASKYEARRLLQAYLVEEGAEMGPLMGARIAYRLGKIGTSRVGGGRLWVGFGDGRGACLEEGCMFDRAGLSFFFSSPAADSLGDQTALIIKLDDLPSLPPSLPPALPFPSSALDVEEPQ